MVTKFGLNSNGVPITICDFAIRKASDPNNDVRKSVLKLLKAIKLAGG